MCTLSWRHSSTHTLILFNRDESYQRGPEGPLKERERNNIKIACPSDGDKGGTWIGLNENGCALALLNHYPLEVTPPPTPKSRGQLVLELLDLKDAEDLERRLLEIDLEPFPPFRLVALDQREVRQGVWNRQELNFNQPKAPLGSSSLDDIQIPKARSDRFQLLPDTDEALEAFHRSHEPEKGAWSTCMHRPDARSCSFTRILLKGKESIIEHVSKPPCEIMEGEEQRLTLPHPSTVQ